MPVGPFSFSAGIVLGLLLSIAIDSSASAAGPYGDRRQRSAKIPRGTHTVADRNATIARLPLQRLTAAAQSRILRIVKSPTLYRRLPTQRIDCQRDMFLFLARNPDVMIGMWDLMGITNVTVNRTGEFQIVASDGSGTRCTIDLIYGDPHLHIFVARGSYDGKLVAKPVRGSGVFVVTSDYPSDAAGTSQVVGTIDCFLQLESLGADLIARTFGGLIGRSADHNFVETAHFISQVSVASRRNPTAMMDVAGRLPQVDEGRRVAFAGEIMAAAKTAPIRRAEVRQDISR